jgi:hypothetical protein
MTELSGGSEPTTEEQAKLAAAEAAFDDFGNWRRQYRRDMLRSPWFRRGALLGLIGGGVWGVMFEGIGTAWEHWEELGNGGGFWGWAIFALLLPAATAAAVLSVADSIVLGGTWIRENRA